MMAMFELDDLVANIDIADMLGVRSSAVANWTLRHPDFPDPVLRVARGAIPLYNRDEIVEWAATTGRLKEGMLP